jgi:hypothetical protein
MIREPCRHLARVFSDTCRFRGKIGAVDQNPHAEKPSRFVRLIDILHVLQEICPAIDAFNMCYSAPSFGLGPEMGNGSEMKSNQREMAHVSRSSLFIRGLGVGV